MNHFFQEQFHGDVILWEDCQEAPPVNHQSAFVPYKPRNESGSDKGCDPKSSNKRMIEFLRRSWAATRVPDRERSQRHMINERMRREREKQHYTALHSILPPGTKSDKKSIIQMATETIQKLQGYKRELERRNYELEPNSDIGGTKIRVSVSNPTSGVDSMVEVLKCLKKLGSRTTSIQSQFSDQKLTAIIDIETQMRGADVEKAVQATLEEVERKPLFNFRES